MEDGQFYIGEEDKKFGKKTIDEYCQLIDEYQGLPHNLARLLLDMGIKYAKMSSIYKDLRVSKNKFWRATKVKGKSDKAVEIEWFVTDEGEKEQRATIELKTLEKLMSNCKVYIRQIENESRNQF